MDILLSKYISWLKISVLKKLKWKSTFEKCQKTVHLRLKEKLGPPFEIQFRKNWNYWVFRPKDVMSSAFKLEVFLSFWETAISRVGIAFEKKLLRLKKFFCWLCSYLPILLTVWLTEKIFLIDTGLQFLSNSPYFTIYFYCNLSLNCRTVVMTSR